MSNTPARELPRYRSHKVVHALQIARIEPAPIDQASASHSHLLHPVEPGYAPIPVSKFYMDKHAPEVGGYYVTYEDGYVSFSPAAAFEAGYTLITE